MVAGVVFTPFYQNLGLGEFDFDTDAFYIALSNTAPTAATDADLGDITQIANGNGYTTGGAEVENSGITDGVFSGDDVVFTASGSLGPFRYVILYDNTHANDLLVGYWDYGSEVTLALGETFTVDFGAAILTIASA